MSSRRVIVSGAELVCSVENTRWPVSDASMPMPAVSLSRISPTMITSGSARRNARIAAAKVKSIFGLHLHLAQTLLRDFDRVFGGPDLHVRRVDGAEDRVQRGGLARAGRTDARGRARTASRAISLKLFRLRSEKPIFSMRQRLRRREDAHHHVFVAVRRRDGRDAQLDRRPSTT